MNEETMKELEEYDDELAGVEDDFEGVCTECHSSQPEQYMIRQLEKEWQGLDVTYPCRYCGGVVRIISASVRDNWIKQQDRRRGLI